MRAKKQGEKIAVEGKEVFVGIDVHKESWQVTARVEGEGASRPWQDIIRH